MVASRWRDLVVGTACVSQLILTAAASNAVPSVKVTFGRIRRLQSLFPPPARGDRLSASWACT